MNTKRRHRTFDKLTLSRSLHREASQTLMSCRLPLRCARLILLLKYVSGDCPIGDVAAAPPAIFAYSGGVQTFVIPPLSSSLFVQLWGAGGGSSADTATACGGGGAYVSGIVPRKVLGGASSLLIAVGGGGPFPKGGASAANPAAFGGALRGLLNHNDDCAAEGAGPSAIAVEAGQPVSYNLIAVAGAGGGAGETASGGAAAFFGTGSAGANPPFPTNFDRLTNTYNTGGGGGGGGENASGGNIGLGFDANCDEGVQTTGTGPFSFINSTAVSVTAGLSMCACAGVGGGGYFGGGPGGWWCGGGGGSSFWNASMFLSDGVSGEGGNGYQPGGISEVNYVAGSGVGACGILQGSGGNGSVVILACVAAPPLPSGSPSCTPNPQSNGNHQSMSVPEPTTLVIASATVVAMLVVMVGLIFLWRSRQSRRVSIVEPFLFVGDGGDGSST